MYIGELTVTAKLTQRVAKAANVNELTTAKLTQRVAKRMLGNCRIRVKNEPVEDEAGSFFEMLMLPFSRTPTLCFMLCKVPERS